MYENLYYYSEEIKGKMVSMQFKPNFRESITLFNGENTILSDGKVTIKGELILTDAHNSEFPDVFISEDAQWGLEDEGFIYNLYVTERTKEINTPLGDAWNNEFNRILKKCKEDYFKRKKSEIRLYFYEAARDKLKLCSYGDTKSNPFCQPIYSYSLDRYFVTYCAIDKHYAKPDKDIFILGRVVKTIGTKNSQLMDFIEPLYEIKLDLEKEKCDYFWEYEYEQSIAELKKALYELLKFTIAKRYDSLEISRIRAYLKSTSEVSDELVAKQFIINIMEAFKLGDIAKVWKLYEVLITPQDCTNVKFQLRLEKEVTCPANKRFSIFFENGENDWMDAKWIYENIHNCTDASGIYIGKLENRYNFY